MKHFLLVLLLLPGYLAAQTNCDDRYLSEVFPTYTLTSDILYGNNTTIGGVNTPLYLDFYQPAGDTLAIRPLIVLVHGLPGDKTDPNIVHFCQQFAKRGFVVASVNTTGFDVFPLDSLQAALGVLKGEFDLKAAIRYFKADYANANIYRVDTANIFAGGFSWGALLGLTSAYMDQQDYYPELQALLDTIPGGMEGNSGNPGYASQFQTVINIAGQIPEVSYIYEPSPTPIVGIHGTNDLVVPYYQGLNSLGDFVYGSGRIHEYADSIQLQNRLITIPNGGHGDYYNNLLYRDSTEKVFSEFFYLIMNGLDSLPIQQANISGLTPVCMDAEPVSLSATPNGGTFSGSGVENGFFDPSMAGVGVHDIRYELMDDCGKTYIDSVQVQVVPLPSQPQIIEGADTLFSTATGIHIWYQDGMVITGADSSFIVPGSSGTYSVALVDSNGCASPVSETVSFIMVTLSNLSSSLLKVYPNPSSGKLLVEYPSAVIGKVELWDLIGKPIAHTQLLSPHAVEIRCKHTGTAILTIKTTQGVIVRKLLFE